MLIAARQRAIPGAQLVLMFVSFYAQVEFELIVNQAFSKVALGTLGFFGMTEGMVRIPVFSCRQDLFHLVLHYSGPLCCLVHPAICACVCFASNQAHVVSDWSPPL